MIKVNIENIADGRKFSGVFEFQAQADTWIQAQNNLKSWGEASADYTITQEDVTSEVNLKKEFAKVRRDQEHGHSVKTEISALLRSKLFDGDITIQELAAIVELDAVKKVERYLTEGYLTLVVPVIQGAQFNFLSQAEVDYFVSKIQE